MGSIAARALVALITFLSLSTQHAAGSSRDQRVAYNSAISRAHTGGYPPVVTLSSDGSFDMKDKQIDFLLGEMRMLQSYSREMEVQGFGAYRVTAQSLMECNRELRRRVYSFQALSERWSMTPTALCPYSVESAEGVWKWMLIICMWVSMFSLLAARVTSRHVESWLWKMIPEKAEPFDSNAADDTNQRDSAIALLKQLEAARVENERLRSEAQSTFDSAEELRTTELVTAKVALEASRARTSEMEQKYEDLQKLMYAREDSLNYEVARIRAQLRIKELEQSSMPKATVDCGTDAMTSGDVGRKATVDCGTDPVNSGGVGCEVGLGDDADSSSTAVASLESMLQEERQRTAVAEEDLKRMRLEFEKEKKELQSALRSKMDESEKSQTDKAKEELLSMKPYIGLVVERCNSRFGVTVSKVKEDTPAARAGIVVGDILERIDDTDCRNPKAVRERLSVCTPGQQICCRVLQKRNGFIKPHTILVAGKKDDGKLVSQETITRLLRVQNGYEALQTAELAAANTLASSGSKSSLRPSPSKKKLYSPQKSSIARPQTSSAPADRQGFARERSLSRIPTISEQ